MANTKLLSLSLTSLKDLETNNKDSLVKVRARVHSLRVKGNIAFIVLRQDINTLQAVAVKSEEINKETLKIFIEFHERFGTFLGLLEAARR